MNADVSHFSDEKRRLLEQLLRQQGLGDSLCPGIPRADRDQPIPVSYIQERFLRHTAPEHSAYVIPFAFYLDGFLDANALERSLSDILRRHEAWRTTFARVGGGFVQRVADELGFRLQKVDLRGSSAREQQERTRALADENAQRPFDLAAGPLVRATLVSLDQQHQSLMLAVHHIISDGWSTGVFCHEFAALYNAYAAGLTSPLPPLPTQYPDYALWQRRELSDEVLETHRVFWRGHLADRPVTTVLPLDRPRPAQQTFEGSNSPLRFPRPLATAVRALSQREGASPFMALLAAFKALLYRYSGQQDLIVGSPIAGRPRVEFERLLGCFINFIVLRTDLSGTRTFRQLLTQVRRRCMEAYAHQAYPFMKLVEELEPQPSPAHHPLFQVMFEVISDPQRSRPALDGLALQTLDFDYGTSEFDLSLILQHDHDDMSGWLLYKTALFDAATIQAIGRDYQQLVEAVVSDPDCPLTSLPVNRRLP